MLKSSKVLHVSIIFVGLIILIVSCNKDSVSVPQIDATAEESARFDVSNNAGTPTICWDIPHPIHVDNHPDFSQDKCYNYAVIRSLEEFNGGGSLYDRDGNPLISESNVYSWYGQVPVKHYDRHTPQTSNLQNLSYEKGDIVNFGGDHVAVVTQSGTYTDAKLMDRNRLGGGELGPHLIATIISAQGSITDVYQFKTGQTEFDCSASLPDAPYITPSSSQNHPMIDWDPIQGASGYKIYKRTGYPANGPYSVVATSLFITDYVDYTEDIYAGIGPKEIVFYKVVAYNGSGDSDFSNYRSWKVASPVILP